MDSRYRIRTPDDIFSPGLVVFADLVRHNLNTMMAMAGKVERLRPHCKTHKMPAVIRMELEQGLLKHKAATLAEVEMLAQTGVRDIVLAYSPVGPNIGRVVRLCQTYPDVDLCVTTDNLPMLTQLQTQASVAGVSLGVLLDVNPGRDRTGLPPGEEAAALYRSLAGMSALRPAGFHLYDGHYHQREFTERLAAVSAMWQQVTAFRDELVKEGLPVPKIICGGTPTFPCYAALDDPAIELSPGTCVFHDQSYAEQYPDLSQFVPAALLLTRVVSRPTANRVTFDLGTKAVASDPPMGQRLILPDLPDAKQVLQNEEHLVVETELANQYQPGDWTLAIPRHVCPCSALHQFATVIEAGEIVDRWEVVARDRQLTV